MGVQIGLATCTVLFWMSQVAPSKQGRYERASCKHPCYNMIQYFPIVNMPTDNTVQTNGTAEATEAMRNYASKKFQMDQRDILQRLDEKLPKNKPDSGPQWH